MNESTVWPIAGFSIIMLIVGCVLAVSSLTRTEDNQAFFYVQVLKDAGVNVTFVASLKNVNNINASLNPIKIPVNYSLTMVSEFGTLESFFNACALNNISTVYFTWKTGHWILAYLQLYPEYQGAEIASYSNRGYDP